MPPQRTADFEFFQTWKSDDSEKISWLCYFNVEMFNFALNCDLLFIFLQTMMTATAPEVTAQRSE